MSFDALRTLYCLKIIYVRIEFGGRLPPKFTTRRTRTIYEYELFDEPKVFFSPLAV